MFSDARTVDWRLSNGPKVRVYSTYAAEAVAVATVAIAIPFYFFVKTFGLSAAMRPHTHTLSLSDTAHTDKPIQGAKETLIVMNKLFAHCLDVVLGFVFPFTYTHSLAFCIQQCRFELFR